eukprot:TRINITY_DN11589_c0_g2_i2.p1 TRINITY_DN11589_c0_g2~~TRINITY_DN11589_c0_g2_i2.p1  ORF type:complete len:1018 (+),score=179.28 TRINITY_DN11589_c0_g2_i2:54-3107(+)
MGCDYCDDSANGDYEASWNFAFPKLGPEQEDFVSCLMDFRQVDPCTSGTMQSYSALEIKGIGRIPLPLDEAAVKSIIPHFEQAPFGKGTETILDTSVRNVKQIDAQKVVLDNPAFNQELESEFDKISKNLQCGKFKAHPYKLLLYEPGSFFKPHTDGEKLDRMFGTLVLQLPSRYEGGQLIIRHHGKETLLDSSSSSSPNAAFLSHWTAFYADVEHEVLPINSGYRLALVYNLTYVGHTMPTCQFDNLEELNRAIDKWSVTQPGKAVGVSLAHQYSEDSLGIENMKGSDRKLIMNLIEFINDHKLIACYGHLNVYASGNEDEIDDQSLRFKHAKWVPMPTLPTEIKPGSLTKDLHSNVVPSKVSSWGEYTGNEGAQCTKQYSNTMLVIAPRRIILTLEQDREAEHSFKAVEAILAKPQWLWEEKLTIKVCLDEFWRSPHRELFARALVSAAPTLRIAHLVDQLLSINKFKALVPVESRQDMLMLIKRYGARLGLWESAHTDAEVAVFKELVKTQVLVEMTSAEGPISFTRDMDLVTETLGDQDDEPDFSSPAVQPLPHEFIIIKDMTTLRASIIKGYDAHLATLDSTKICESACSILDEQQWTWQNKHIVQELFSRLDQIVPPRRRDHYWDYRSIDLVSKLCSQLSRIQPTERSKVIFDAWLEVPLGALVKVLKDKPDEVFQVFCKFKLTEKQQTRLRYDLRNFFYRWLEKGWLSPAAGAALDSLLEPLSNLSHLYSNGLDQDDPVDFASPQLLSDGANTLSVYEYEWIRSGAAGRELDSLRHVDLGHDFVQQLSKIKLATESELMSFVRNKVTWTLGVRCGYLWTSIALLPEKYQKAQDYVTAYSTVLKMCRYRELAAEFESDCDQRVRRQGQLLFLSEVELPQPDQHPLNRLTCTCQICQDIASFITSNQGSIPLNKQTFAQGHGTHVIESLPGHYFRLVDEKKSYGHAKWKRLEKKAKTWGEVEELRHAVEKLRILQEEAKQQLAQEQAALRQDTDSNPAPSSPTGAPHEQLEA